MSDLVLDASLTLQWFLEDEADRRYSLNILSSLAEKRALVPIIWFYEVGNGLLMACRRKRVTFPQVEAFLERLKALPIDAAPHNPDETLDLAGLAQAHNLTTYDAAYLALALHKNLPLATSDSDLRQAAAAAGTEIVPA